MRSLQRLGLAAGLFLMESAHVHAGPEMPPPSDAEMVVFYSASALLIVIGPLVLGALVARFLFRLHWRRPLFYLVTFLVALPFGYLGVYGTMFVFLIMTGRPI